jgi:septal ring factor EnvC (AmiA/AmiB activator)
MPSLLYALLRTSVVLFIGLTASAFVTVWFLSGKMPRSTGEVSTGLSEMLRPPQKIKDIQAANFKEADKIADDFDSVAAKLAKTNHIRADVPNEKYETEIQSLKSQMDKLQKQLDKIESENRDMNAQLSELVKNTRPKN